MIDAFYKLMKGKCRELGDCPFEGDSECQDGTCILYKRFEGRTEKLMLRILSYALMTVLAPVVLSGMIIVYVVGLVLRACSWPVERVEDYRAKKGERYLHTSNLATLERRNEK